MSTAPVPLRARVTLELFRVVGTFILLGGIVSYLIYSSGDMYSKTLINSYASIRASTDMLNAWDALRYVESQGSLPREHFLNEFENSLRNVTKNAKDEEELSLINSIKEHWGNTNYRSEILTIQEFQHIKADVRKLITIHEKRMIDAAAESQSGAEKIIWLALVLLALAIVYTLISADAIAARITLPVRQIAETLQSKPSLDQKLKLPQAQSIELKILLQELKELWKRLGEVDQVNIRRLVQQKSELEMLLSAVEDAIIVLDGEDRVLHVSKRFVDIVAMRYEEVSQAIWSDLPSASENYMILRDFFKEGENEGHVHLNVDGESKLFEIRKKTVKPESTSRISLNMFLLHDVERLPTTTALTS